jgi:hypothetical protein
LKRVALKSAFLDPVNLEDGEKQCQKREIAEERAETAAAGFGLAGKEARFQQAVRGLLFGRRGQVLLM